MSVALREIPDPEHNPLPRLWLWPVASSPISQLGESGKISATPDPDPMSDRTQSPCHDPRPALVLRGTWGPAKPSTVSACLSASAFKDPHQPSTVPPTQALEHSASISDSVGSPDGATQYSEFPPFTGPTSQDPDSHLTDSQG